MSEQARRGLESFSEEAERQLRQHPLFRNEALELVNRHQEQSSHVLAYRRRSNPHAPLVLLKVKKGYLGPERAEAEMEREYAGLEWVWARASAELGGTFPKPLAALPGAGAIAFESVPGTPLTRIMMWSANPLTGPLRKRKLAQTGRMAGTWLRRFHGITASTSAAFDSDAYFAELSKWLERCAAGGLTKPVAHEVGNLAWEASKLAHGEISPSAARHGDFIPQNILVDGNHISVIDFGGFEKTDVVYEDVCFFYAYLALASRRAYYWGPAVRAMAASFLESYGTRAGTPLFNLYVIKAMLKIVAFKFSNRRGRPFNRREMYRLEADLLPAARGLLGKNPASKGAALYV